MIPSTIRSCFFGEVLHDTDEYHRAFVVRLLSVLPKPVSMPRIAADNIALEEVITDVERQYVPLYPLEPIDTKAFVDVRVIYRANTSAGKEKATAVVDGLLTNDYQVDMNTSDDAADPNRLFRCVVFVLSKLSVASPSCVSQLQEVLDIQFVRSERDSECRLQILLLRPVDVDVDGLVADAANACASRKQALSVARAVAAAGVHNAGELQRRVVEAEAATAAHETLKRAVKYCPTITLHHRYADAIVDRIAQYIGPPAPPRERIERDELDHLVLAGDVDDVDVDQVNLFDNDMMPSPIKHVHDEHNDETTTATATTIASTASIPTAASTTTTATTATTATTTTTTTTTSTTTVSSTAPSDVAISAVGEVCNISAR